MEKFLSGDKLIQELDDGTVIVCHGPMLMSIFASDQGKPDRNLAKKGAEKALAVLESLAKFRSTITRNIQEIGSVDSFPKVIQKMVLASRKFEDTTVTPLIAVAGAGADEVADWILNNGRADKIVVNNGGDIAIRLRNGDVVRTGIKSDLKGESVSHVITATLASRIGGVATSGFGGRSFTRGIANAAVAIAKDATSADVAATLIGNATDVESPNVTKVRAKELYQATDIPDLWVTKVIGPLEESQIEEALDRGMEQARVFQERDLIFGAFVAVKDQFRISESIRPFFRRLSLN